MVPYPLFPLPVVLFPGALMPLHIFEPRYRAMLADAAQGDHRFVLLPPGPLGDAPLPGAIGTVARVRAIQPLADGRSNIVVGGDRRVSLVRLVPTDKPYLIGAVDDLLDEPETQAPSAADIATLRERGERLATAMGVIADLERQPEFSDDPAVLTFQIAALVEWDDAEKRAFLSIRSVRERATRLLHLLPALVADAEDRAAVHRRAPTNGKGPHH
jgi:Lon protease-like protein